METMVVKAAQRTTRGTRKARALRCTGQLPATIYGHGEPPESVAVLSHDFEVALAHGARMLQLVLDGKKNAYLIKEVQYDPVSSKPMHADFARVDLTERVQVRVGVELRGTPKGVSSGGVLDQFLANIEVECLVTDIPDTLHPTVGHLELGQSLLIKDLVVPPGVVILADPNDRVATVREVGEAKAAPVAVEGEQPAEPELIGRVRKTEEEEAAE